MPKVMRVLTIVTLAAALFTLLLFCSSGRELYLTLAITFGTTAYHLGIRLLAGLLFQAVMGNRADYTRRWYRVHPWENGLYRLLQVKKWKNGMPTYHPETFSREKHSWEEIAQAMCQSELVHEANVILSFVPLAASGWFDSFYPFFITSFLAAAFDLMFVVIQRYNRARIEKILAKAARKEKKMS